MEETKVTSCQFCGDACGQEVCLACQDTAEDMGFDIDELMEMY